MFPKKLLNEPQFVPDFKEFCRRMRSKQLFLDSLSENFSDKPVNRSEFARKPPKGLVNLEVF